MCNRKLGFPPFFLTIVVYSSTSTMATGCDRRVPLGARMCKAKLGAPVLFSFFSSLIFHIFIIFFFSISFFVYFFIFFIFFSIFFIFFLSFYISFIISDIFFHTTTQILYNGRRFHGISDSLIFRFCYIFREHSIYSDVS